jgi:hypothetical protein
MALSARPCSRQYNKRCRYTFHYDDYRQGRGESLVRIFRVSVYIEKQCRKDGADVEVRSTDKPAVNFKKYYAVDCKIYHTP